MVLVYDPTEMAYIDISQLSTDKIVSKEKPQRLKLFINETAGLSDRISIIKQHYVCM